jgi:hypothetical protein
MAVDDDILRKNPFEFMFATVLVNDTVTREAITKKKKKEHSLILLRRTSTIVSTMTVCTSCLRPE